MATTRRKTPISRMPTCGRANAVHTSRNPCEKCGVPIIRNPGRIVGFQPFCTSEFLTKTENLRQRSEARYMVVVHPRHPSWKSWKPGTLEDVPPELGDRGLYRECLGFGEALSKSRSLNSQWLGVAPKRVPDQWAIVVCLDAVNPQLEVVVRIVTPLAYRSREIQLSTPWIPLHLMDVPPHLWKDKIQPGHGLPRYDSFEAAVQNVIAQNRSKCSRASSPVDSWHILIALESQVCFEQAEYRCWKPTQGVMSLEASRKFHVFDRSDWPLPDGAQLEIHHSRPQSTAKPGENRRDEK